MVKVDFHTHSVASPDGGIGLEQYANALEDGLLDCIAVTDHNTIGMALELAQAFPGKIIPGEEIMTKEGELVGLFLGKVVASGQSLEDTIAAIKSQGGLVYVPHPFETVRHGITKEALDRIATRVDIIEVHNGRAFFQRRGPEAATWARLNRVAAAASSDAHGYKGLGTTHTSLAEMPTASNLVELLAQARMVINRPPLKTLLYPKMHRLRKRLLKK